MASLPLAVQAVVLRFVLWFNVDGHLEKRDKMREEGAR